MVLDTQGMNVLDIIYIHCPWHNYEISEDSLLSHSFFSYFQLLNFHTYLSSPPTHISFIFQRLFWSQG